MMDKHDEWLVFKNACDDWFISALGMFCDILLYILLVALGDKAWIVRWMIGSYAMIYVGWYALLNDRCMLECVWV